MQSGQFCVRHVAEKEHPRKRHPAIRLAPDSPATFEIHPVRIDRKYRPIPLEGAGRARALLRMQAAALKLQGIHAGSGRVPLRTDEHDEAARYLKMAQTADSWRTGWAITPTLPRMTTRYDPTLVFASLMRSASRRLEEVSSLVRRRRKANSSIQGAQGDTRGRYVDGGACWNSGANLQIPARYRFLVESQHWDIRTAASEASLTIEGVAYPLAQVAQRLLQGAVRPDRLPRRRSQLTCRFEEGAAIEKDDLLANVARIQIREGGEKLFYSETSGSLASPWCSIETRSGTRGTGHRFTGAIPGSACQPWERNGYLWGYNFAFGKRLKTRFLDFLQNRFRLFSYRDDEIDDFSGSFERRAS